MVLDDAAFSFDEPLPHGVAGMFIYTTGSTMTGRNTCMTTRDTCSPLAYLEATPNGSMVVWFADGELRGSDFFGLPTVIGLC